MIEVTDELLQVLKDYCDFYISGTDAIERIIELHEQSKLKPEPLYSAPQPLEPLSEHEVNNIVFNLSKGSTLFDFARLVEQAHGIGATNE